MNCVENAVFGTLVHVLNAASVAAWNCAAVTLGTERFVTMYRTGNAFHLSGITVPLLSSTPIFRYAATLAGTASASATRTMGRNRRILIARRLDPSQSRRFGAPHEAQSSRA